MAEGKPNSLQSVPCCLKYKEIKVEKTIYVIGHRNPDTDSIASAIAYARLKGLLGQENVVAAMAGSPNPQTRYILERLGIDPPVYLADVHPTVRHVLNRRPVIAHDSMILREALELFHRHTIRVLPVVDDAGMPVGIVSLLKLSEKYLVAGTGSKRVVKASLRALAECLSGTFLAGASSDTVEELHLFIGAMSEESFSDRLAGYEPQTLLIMTGDRRVIQEASIAKGVRILVITGGLTVSDEILEAARCAGVTVLSTSHDTATAAGLVRLAAPLDSYVEKEFARIGIGEPLEHLRVKLLHSGEAAIIAVEEDGTVAGVATKSSLLAPIPHALILVDHNELGQSVAGAESVEILEIIDHHKLGNPFTTQPITFLTAPVGSTCTVVASLFRERGVDPDPRIAALLLAGILSDTVILRSLTTTGRDREMVSWLEELSGLDHLLFGREIFTACSGFSAHDSLEEAIRSDFKHFTAGDDLFGIGQVEVVGFDEFFEVKEDLRAVLTRIKKEDGLSLAGLMVTDIYSETTLFLVEGKNELAHIMGYPQREPHLYELKGVMSRKKQLVPHLLKVLAAL
jgi:manganese-dependent inorganic pyrophosphatase